MSQLTSRSGVIRSLGRSHITCLNETERRRLTDIPVLLAWKTDFRWGLSHISRLLVNRSLLKSANSSHPVLRDI